MSTPRVIILSVVLSLVQGVHAVEGPVPKSLFPDLETAFEAQFLAQLPRVIEHIWASQDLAVALQAGKGDAGLAVQYWENSRQPPGPDAAKRLAQIAEICLPLSQRDRIVEDPRTPTFGDLWWRYATKDWLTALDTKSMTPAQVDALVLGQLDGSAPVRLHPECEELVALAAHTSGQALEKFQDFLANAKGWIDTQLFNDLIPALWKTHAGWRPATGAAWGDLYLKDSGTRLLVTTAIGEVYQDNSSPMVKSFIIDGMNRFPSGVAGKLGAALFIGTPDRPAVTSPEETLAWLEKRIRDPGWNPHSTLDLLDYWVMGVPGNWDTSEPADHLAIGRNAGKILTLYQQALRDSKPGMNKESPEFIRRLKAYEAEWIRTRKP